MLACIRTICKWILIVMVLCVLVPMQGVAMGETYIREQGMRLVSMPRDTEAADSVKAITAAYITADHTMLRVGEEMVWTLHLEGTSANAYTFDYSLFYQTSTDTSDTYYYSAGVTGVKESHYVQTPTAQGKYIVVVSIRDQYGGVLEVESVVYVTAYDALVEKVAEVVSLCRESGASSTKDIALFMHDYLINNAEYDQSYTYFTPDGVLLYGTGVCESYATAYQILLGEMGVDCLFVKGTADGVSHGWNLVKIDNVWYHVDCTFDDPVGGEESSAYFLLPDEVCSIDHVWNEANYPECKSGLYLHNDIIFADAEEFFAQMNALVEQGVFSVYIYYVGSYENFTHAQMAVIVQKWFDLYSDEYGVTGAMSRAAQEYPRFEYHFTLESDAEITDEYDHVIGDFGYSVEDGCIRIARYLGTDIKVSIPAMINDLPVTTLGKYTFSFNTTLQSVILPDTLTLIEDGVHGNVWGDGFHGAFSGCTNLTTISIPDNVLEIGQYAFYGCTSLADVSLNEGLERIGQQAFSGCALTELDLPSTIRIFEPAVIEGTQVKRLEFTSALEYYADGQSLDFLEWIEVSEKGGRYTSVDGVLFDREGKMLYDYPPAKADAKYSIPEGCTSINSYALNNAKHITELHLPSTLMYYDWAVQYPRNLTSITVAEDNPWFVVVDGVLYTKDMTELVYFPKAMKLETYKMPDTVTKRHYWALQCLKYVKCIVLSKNLTEVVGGTGGCGLDSCPALEAVIYPLDYKGKDYLEMSDCPNLKYVQLPMGISTIGFNFFYNCRSLQTVVLPDSLETIGMQAFSCCYKLSEIEIPSSVTTIDGTAFNACGSLTTVYLSHIPEFISKSPFGRGNVTIKSANPDLAEFAAQYGYGFELICKDHTWDQGEFIPPIVAEAAGVMKYTCTVCGAPKSQYIAPVLGDADGNGVVNLYDALLALQYTAGWDLVCSVNADINADSCIDINDVLQILESCLNGDMNKALRALDAIMKNMSINALRMVEQPADQYVTIGKRGQFAVSATGDGLIYQWYINRNDGKGWSKLNGATGTTYTTSVVRLDDDSCQYRCVITDVYGNEITSDAAVLHAAYELPVTGDTANLALWLIMCLLSAAGIAIMKKKRIVA